MDNDSLIKVLELDNKFDYNKGTRIRTTEDGYEIFEEAQKVTALENSEIAEITILQTEEHLNLSK